jgi:hypothetical protein
MRWSCVDLLEATVIVVEALPVEAVRKEDVYANG